MGNWFVIIHILGAVQGVFLAAVLMSEWRHSVANRVLAATMLAFALDLAIAVYHATGVDAAFPHLIGIDYPLALLYGPLLFLYARTLSGRARTFRTSYLWHFAPFALVLLLMLPFYLQSGADKLAYVHGSGHDAWTQGLGLITHLKILHALAYLGFTLVLLRRHRRRIQDLYADTERINLIWLRNLMIGLVVLMGIAVALYLLSLPLQRPAIGMDDGSNYDDYMLLSLALFVYTIGFMGLRQPDVFDGVRPRPAPPEGDADEEPDGRSAPSRAPYAKSGLDPAALDRHKAALLALMDTEYPYRRGDLTLQDLAEALAISPHNLTEVINTQIGLNFYDFVNGYRVREVEQRLSDPATAALTLLAIGLEAGFNSKSAFNAVFKKHTGMTPSQYRSQAEQAAAS